MAYKYYGKQTFKATVNGNDYVINCYGQGTRYGFRHVAFLDKGYTEVQLAKACYYNRTWERFTYETVLKKAIDNLPKEDRQGLYDILIEHRAQAEHEQAEREIAVFEKLYNATSPELKEKLKDLPPITNETQAGIVKMMCAFDVLMNNNKDK